MIVLNVLVQIITTMVVGASFPALIKFFVLH